MAETKIEQWKRRIAHKCRKEKAKQEAKEIAAAMDTWNTVKNGVQRPLKGNWTHSVHFDLDSMHGIDIEDEITSRLAGEMMKEIDKEIIKAFSVPQEMLEPRSMHNSAPAVDIAFRKAKSSGKS